MKPIIFTDLDGTLLDAGYSFSKAAEALERIRSGGIPLVLVTSKTRAEVEVVRERLSNRHPFITENGGGIYIPKGYFPFPLKGTDINGYTLIPLGRRYGEVREAFIKVRAALKAGARGFGDMPDEEVSLLTGLTKEAARLARMRDFDEPFIMEGGAEMEERLERAFEREGLSITRGKFLHLMGPHDKGRAVDILSAFYKELYGSTVTIGLGNGSNDLPLLKAVEYPVLLMNEDGAYEDASGVRGLIRAPGAGPGAWNRAVNGILDTIEASQRGRAC